MLGILEFVRNGGGLSEDELAALVKERMLRIPAATQRNWLRQLILALDGYGGPRHLAAADRVRTVVRQLEAELPPRPAAPAAPGT